ncbi:hypothetical protein [Bacillus sp. UMB0893]|uniref:hypothetical protein n=1 Tax=Bacillus sp. UMB0893 TaxID=2066053 RepID=UPI002152AC5A|nr:hypothetical protein [Bacillus sp. UMB0893]
MLASNAILSVWRNFDEYPMETLTKGWYFNKAGIKKQRELSLMKEHWQQYGISGNCFDLTIWLLDEFTKAGIEAYPIGHDLKTSRAHVAAIALDEMGKRYLCDLGDQWLNPILIDGEAEDFTNDRLEGFFPAAAVEVDPCDDNVKVTYHRPNGKMSNQTYQTAPIEMTEFLAAAECSQNLIKSKPLLEKRVKRGNETAHWEFYNWKSFLSTNNGLYNDAPANTIEEWAERIHQKTKYDIEFLVDALGFYRKVVNEKNHI